RWPRDWSSDVCSSDLAIINAVVYLLQELELWSPFKTSTAASEHLARTALLGNPNDVGSYFVAPALGAAALALSQRRWRIVWAARSEERRVGKGCRWGW